MRVLIIITFVYNTNLSNLFVIFFTYKSAVKNRVSKILFSFLLLFLDY